MNVTEQARRSDSLYFSSNDGINRRWLCDKVASLEAENATLRMQLVDATESMGRVEERCAELRELMHDMLHDAMENVCSKAYWCGKKSWQTCNDKECGNRLYVEMARELGIEVDA